MTPLIRQGAVVQLIAGQAVWRRMYRSKSYGLYRADRIVAAMHRGWLSIPRSTDTYNEKFPEEMSRRDREIALYIKLVEFGLMDPIQLLLLT